MERTVQKEKTELAEQVYFPTAEYDRSEFYETTDNVRYMLKINLINGQQAEDVPVGIEDLVEFLGDVEWIIDSTECLSINYRRHDSWTARLNTGDDTRLNSFDWKEFEERIEEKAEEHGICLKKSVSMSGRGYSSSGRRCVGVNYSFGTYKSSGERDLIENEHNPLSKVEWVGGELGDKENLNESTIEIKSVETKSPSFLCSIIRSLKSSFTLS